MGRKTKKSDDIKFKFCIKEIERSELKFRTLDISEVSKSETILSKLKDDVKQLESELKEVFLDIYDDDELLYAQYSEAKDKIFDMITKINELLKNCKNQTGDCSRSTVNNSHDNNLKLPKFELPVFYGDINEWLSFKEIFVSSIHNNDSLTELQKLQYLSSSVKGSASKLIAGFAISAHNYNDAWDTLMNRYDNKRELAYAQLSKIFNLKPLKYVNQKTILELYDTCNEAIRNLKSLNFEFNSLVDLILVFHLQSKLDVDLRRQWELFVSDSEFPTYENLMSFLDKHAKSFQRVPEQHTFKSELKSKVVKRSNAIIHNAVVNSQNQKWSCYLCKEKHGIHKCQQFKNMSVQERWNFVKNKKLCINCLRNNHFSSACLISTGCRTCKRNHHTMLHSEQCSSDVNSKEIPVSETAVIPEGTDSNCLATQTNSTNCQTLLSTAVIQVKSNTGQFLSAKALIDSGSQKSLISKDFCTKLGLPTKNTRHRILGINNSVIESSVYEVNLTFTSYFKGEVFNIDALVVNKVTSNLPNFTFCFQSWPHLEGLQLADPTFYKSSPVDLLIGADIYAEILIGQSILGPKGSPSAINSKLGWLLSGVIYSPYASYSAVNCHATVDLDTDLQKFWQLESIPNSVIIPSSEQNFVNSVVRTNSGRYMVDLPFKSTPTFGDSKSLALKRFLALERKLQCNYPLKQQYSQFLKEYLELKHMELVPYSDLNSPNCFYLPHHGVVKEDSTTTKLRVVFDASARDSEGHSLNDFLEIGPKLQPEIFNILLKFRTHPIALSADIEKMYRQILINSKHADFQRILWRFNSNEPINSYRLLTVTYGTASAPYLAIRTLKELAKDYEIEFPDASRIIKNDFYVDDLLSGADSIHQAKQIVSDLNSVMKYGQFTLRKWTSNFPEVLSNLPNELKSSTQETTIETNSSIKVLGLFWNSSKDVIQIRIARSEMVTTKRQLLSVIAKFFDPLGFLCPTTICLKIMMQNLWKDKISWDSPIPSYIQKSWQEINSQLEILKQIEVPRFLNTVKNSDSTVQLHGFCDGSGKAYAAVIYLRVISCTGEVSVNFTAAKTKVNPLKPVTLPRIELCAALLLAQLCHAVLQILPITIHEIFFWSDSQIVLSWIDAPPEKGNQFVLNRVNQLKSLVPEGQWHYIQGNINPADCASRGIMPNKLLKHPLWWSGPPWLSANAEIPFHSFDSKCYSQSDIHTPDVINHATLIKTVPDIFLISSSFSKLVRVFAFCRRFINNCQKPSDKSTGPLSAVEIDSAEIQIIKILQGCEFSNEMHLLQHNLPLPSSNKLLTLNIFLDKSNLLRVGGRLSLHKSINEYQKYPILLPNNHPITNLIIEHYHYKHFHAGPQLTLALIRQKFWFTNGRTKVRHILNRCLLCKRLRAATCQQIMANLPEERIQPIRPFKKIGIDFCGPIITKPNLLRSKVKLKSYICVIICMCTKSVHLECVSDLSTQALLACLKRFISRRGLPSDIFSDNGKNFVGLANDLKALFKLLKSEGIQDFSASQSITWHFIPPYSPNFGGIWEAAVKSTKGLLVKACKSAILNFEELTTCLCQIEALLNSRPLIPMSSDPSDLTALTPGHFLIGSPLLDIPDSPGNTTLPLNERWKLIQKMRLHFWNRWSREYLNHLQQRPKSKSSHFRDIQIGDLVAIHNPNAPPLKWFLGRVIETFPGSDGHVRVVNIRTSSGVVRRPLSKITLLLPRPEDVQSS